MFDEGKDSGPGNDIIRSNQLSRWDDDVVFKNQARGTEDKRKKEFVNVKLLHLYVSITQATDTDTRTYYVQISISALW